MSGSPSVPRGDVSGDLADDGGVISSVAVAGMSRFGVIGLRFATPPTRRRRFSGDPYFRTIRSLAAFSGDRANGELILLSGDLKGDLTEGEPAAVRPVLIGDLI